MQPLDMEIFGEKGQGETMMMAFIQQQLANILHPVTDRIDTLNQVVDVLSKDLTKLDSEHDSVKKLLDRHTQLLEGFRVDINDTASKVAAVQAKAKQSNQEKTVREADHQLAKSRLSKLEDRFLVAESKLLEAQSCIKETYDAVDTTRAKLSNVENYITDKVEPTIDQFGREINTVYNMQQTLAHTLGGTKKLVEDKNTAFEAFQKNVEQQDQNNEDHFHHVKASLKQLAASLAETKRSFHRHADHLKDTKVVVQPVKEKINQMSDDLEALKTKHECMDGTLMCVNDRQKNILANISRLKDQFGEDNINRGANIIDDVEKLQETMKHQVMSIQSLSNHISGYDERFVKGDARTMEFENMQEKIQQKLHQLERLVGLTLEGKEEANATRGALSFHQAAHQVSLTARQNQFKHKMDTHDVDIETTKGKLQKTTSDLDAQGQRMAYLENELAAQNELVQKLKAGLELTQEYWKGFSNGFRDTTIRAPVLPVLSKEARPLPPRSKTPRTPRSVRPRN